MSKEVLLLGVQRLDYEEDESLRVGWVIETQTGVKASAMYSAQAVQYNAAEKDQPGDGAGDGDSDGDCD